MLLFNLGLCYALPSIVIPALTGIQNEYNRNETLSITAAQASWLGNFYWLVFTNTQVKFILQEA